MDDELNQPEAEKSDTEKFLELSGKLTEALESTLGKKLDDGMQDEVDALASGVVFADKNATKIESLLANVLKETKLQPSQIGPVVDMVSQYHPEGSEQANFVNKGVQEFRASQTPEAEPVVEKPKTAQEKTTELTGNITKELENALGKPLDAAQREEVNLLVGDVVKADKNGLGMDELLTSLATSTGLKPSQIGPVVDMISQFHPEGSEQANFVKDGVDKFQSVQVEKQRELLNTAGKSFDDKIENALGKPMNPEQKHAADTLFGDLVSVNKENVGNLDQSYKDLQQATGLSLEQIKGLANDVVNTVHPDDKGKKDLVNDSISKQLQTPEVEVELAPDRPKNADTELVHEDTELAQDSFILPEAKKSGQEQSLATSGQSKDDRSKDEIIEAIRKEVIQKQNSFLVDKIAERLDVPIPQQQAFKNQLNTPDKMREYLESDEGKKRVDMAMKEKAVQNGLAKIESTGYSKVHEQFKESYRDVAWKQEQGSKTRVSEVTNANGEKIASIKETTHDTKPTTVTLSDGTEKTIRSYREVDFPKNLESGKGPAHFSMALKDENGRNVPEKDAVYFTAHYDDSGKLMEVSSPKPVKFMGEGADAIGYIERNGQVLTLPVTQGKYEEMMKEVAINNGRSNTVDRSVEQAVDSVAVGTKEPPVKAKEQVNEPTVTTKPQSVQVSDSNKPVVNPLSGQVVDPQVAKKAEKMKEGLENPTPRAPAQKEQQNRPRSQSLPAQKAKPKEGMAM